MNTGLAGAAALKRGLAYERKVTHYLVTLYGAAFRAQVRVATGIMDGLLCLDDRKVILEIKNTFTPECVAQLARYASCYTEPIAQVAIVRNYSPRFKLGLPVELHANLGCLDTLATGLHVIPFSGRFL